MATANKQPVRLKRENSRRDLHCVKGNRKDAYPRRPDRNLQINYLTILHIIHHPVNKDRSRSRVTIALHDMHQTLTVINTRLTSTINCDETVLEIVCLTFSSTSARGAATYQAL